MNNKRNRALMVISVLLAVYMVSMSYGVYKLLYGTKNQGCAIEVQFSGGSKATYIGRTV